MASIAAAGASLSNSCFSGPPGSAVEPRLQKATNVRLQSSLWGQNIVKCRRSSVSTAKCRRTTVAVIEKNSPDSSTSANGSVLSSEGTDEELASRIASGEFTVAAAKKKDKFANIRQALANGGPPGRFLSFALANYERRLKQESLKKLPEAKGDVRKIVGQPFFVPLFTLFRTYGGIFRLSFGPKSFVIVSDPTITKRILKDNAKSYSKFVTAMLSLFGDSTIRLCDKLDTAASNGDDVEMEGLFSRLTLDVIGKAVFNYDFDSLSNETGIVEAVYVTLREAEDRSVGIFPYWKIPILAAIDPRQRRVAKALKVVNDTLDSLIDKCKVTSKQLRDDLMTMLIAGHETSAAVLTWTFYLLSMVDAVLGDRAPTIDDMKKLQYTTNIINESMRLYPQPPVLIRRTMEDDMLGPYLVKEGEDLFISVWNLHRSPLLWENADAFQPERWDTYSAAEASQAFRYIPFGGGPRKCVGDVFATYEVVTALAMLARRFNFELAAGAPPVSMTTGATIHTTNGLHMTVTHRTRAPVIPVTDVPSLTTVDENGVIKSYSASDGSISVLGPSSSGCPASAVPQNFSASSTLEQS
ncbi:hypothetical protein AXG93_3506s1020 [Marchantia polymorpha subsp. ruderalis]|uniref:Cytochrome P450 n=1 Tax=Marchantia polymorpha subsp. ruderalis TaxID=1480154 RepID=A0A176VKD5_MARPO|nr:hypothetical protein AXG93_3506s1020 [Marchantia polymorpha subsp. ruderalis]